MVSCSWTSVPALSSHEAAAHIGIADVPDIVALQRFGAGRLRASELGMYQSLSSSLRRLDAEERLSLIASIAEEVCLSGPLRDADHPTGSEYVGMLVNR